MGALTDLLLDGAGVPRFERAVLDDAIAWLLLGALDDSTALPEEAERHLGALAERAGVTPDMDAPATRACVQRYFDAHPLPPSLRTSLEQALRGMAAAGGESLGRELQSVTGAVQPAGVLERKAPPPAGTVGAGPMARFQLDKKR
jgi:hypothetical protein